MDVHEGKGGGIGDIAIPGCAGRYGGGIDSHRYPDMKKPRGWRTRRGAINHRPASTSVVKADGRSRRLGGAKLFGGSLAATVIRDGLEGDLLALIERVHTGAFDRADVNEDVLAVEIGRAHV